MGRVTFRGLFCILALWAPLTSGCFQECTSNADCRDRFGETFSCDLATNDCIEFAAPEPGEMTRRDAGAAPSVTLRFDAGAADAGAADASAADTGTNGSIPDTGVAPSTNLAGLVWFRGSADEGGPILEHEIRFQDWSEGTIPTLTPIPTATACSLLDQRGSFPPALPVDAVRLTPVGANPENFVQNAGRFFPEQLQGLDRLSGAVAVEVLSAMPTGVRSRRPLEVEPPAPFVPQSPRPYSTVSLRGAFTWFAGEEGPSDVVFEMATTERLVVLQCRVPYADQTFTFPEAALLALQSERPGAGFFKVYAYAESSWVMPLDVDAETFDGELRISQGTTYYVRGQ